MDITVNIVIFIMGLIIGAMAEYAFSARWRGAIETKVKHHSDNLERHENALERLVEVPIHIKHLASVIEELKSDVKKLVERK